LGVNERGEIAGLSPEDESSATERLKRLISQQVDPESMALK
jgi:hypothetical protein